MARTVEDMRRTARTERVPPHNLEAEESVLGSMMLSGDAIAAVVEIVKADDFYRSAHQRIYESICADCWTDWFKNYSIKVINELRLDLSTEHGQEEYDKYMRGFFGFED